jgi:multiple sugar transport system permease protein
MEITTKGFRFSRLLALLPALIVFFIAQKYFIEGISLSSGIKG